MKKFDARVFMTALRQETGEAEPPRPGVDVIRRLLALEGEEFLRRSYRSILGREVDLPGLEAYRQKAETGRGRLAILAALWLSPERVCLPLWQRALFKKCASLFGRFSGANKAP